MTYRMQGLGAALLTPEQMSFMTQTVLASGGCSGAFKASAQALSCLTPQQVQWLGTCYTKATTPGVTSAQLASSCDALFKCGMFGKLGCPGDAASMTPTVPDCWTDALYGEIGPVIDYCKAYPQFGGPNAQYNAGCWSMSRYPAVYQKLLATPRCAPPKTAGLINPPTRPAPVIVASAPPPNTSAAVTTDSTPAAYVPPDSTPGNIDVQLSPPDMIDTGPASASADDGMSTTTMAMIGIGGVLALGLGYMLLKKRK